MRCRTVASPQPNQLWRTAVQDTPVIKVQILGNYGKTLSRSELPYLSVVGSSQSAIVDVRGIRKQVGHTPDKLQGKVLIEQQLHRR